MLTTTTTTHVGVVIAASFRVREERLYSIVEDIGVVDVVG